MSDGTDGERGARVKRRRLCAVDTFAMEEGELDPELLAPSCNAGFCCSCRPCPDTVPFQSAHKLAVARQLTSGSVTVDVDGQAQQVKFDAIIGAAQGSDGFLFTVRFGGRTAVAMMDTGASESFVDQDWLERGQQRAKACGFRWRMSQLARPMRILTANSGIVPVSRSCAGAVQLQGTKSKVEAKVMRNLMHGVDLILGMDYLRRYDVDLSCGRLCAKLTVNGRRRTVCAKQNPLADVHPDEPAGLAAAMREASGSEPLTAKACVRALRHGARSFLVLVQPDDGKGSHVRTPSTFMCAPKACKLGSVRAVNDPMVVKGLMPEATLRRLLEEFADVFAEMPPGVSDKMPAVGHTIRLEPGHVPPYRRQYRLTVEEMEEVKRQVAELLKKGFIEPSSSPFGAPVLFVQKKDGTLRMCIDYRALNAITVKDRYPLPNIQDLIDKLHGKTVFSSLDLQSGYHQIKITPDDVPKTAFLTPMGQFQFKVLCFGLTNAPATFQRVMNNIFSDYIGKFVLVYLDDILVMSETPEQHAEHLKLVLERLRQYKLYAKLKKCEFNKPELKFLGHVVGREGVAVDPDKIAVIAKWPAPRNVKQLQGFLGLGNYFRKFVPHYSTLVAPLTDLTRKERAATFNWETWDQDKECAEWKAFEKLKSKLMQAPVLALPDLRGEFEVHTDASVVGSGGVLIQNGRALAFTSAKFSKAEYNYATGEQEFLAIIHALKQWRCYLEGSKKVTIVTDHQPLTYLQTQQGLSRRQARWIEFLSRFNWVIKYKPGAGNLADAISRNPAFSEGRLAALMSEFGVGEIDGDSHVPMHVLPIEGSHDGFLLMITTRSKMRMQLQMQPVQKPAVPGTLSTPMQAQGVAPGSDVARGEMGEKVAQDVSPTPGSTTAEAFKPHDSLIHEIMRGYPTDPKLQDPEYTKGFTYQRGVWLLHGKIVVPSSPLVRRRVMHDMHCAPQAGHPGIRRTVELVERFFWWPSLKEDVTTYVEFCDACQRAKSHTQKPYGLLRPLSIPGRCWDMISCDFVVKLPTTARGFDSILVVVDRLSKMVHLIPCKESIDAQEVAELFEREVIRLHGIPRDIVSDRDTRFNSHFWKAVCEHLKINPSMSSAYHPQSDGQTERMNRVIEEILRSYVRPDMADWDRRLPMVEFAMNNAWNSTTHTTPFFAVYGQHPRMPGMELPEWPDEALGRRGAPSMGEEVAHVDGAVAPAKRQRMSKRRARGAVRKHKQTVDDAPVIPRVPAAYNYVQELQRTLKTAEERMVELGHAMMVPQSRWQREEQARHVRRIVKEVRAHMREAQTRMVAYANKKRRGLEVKAGDLVLVSTKNLYEKGSRKLQPRFIGPFKVVRPVGAVAAELELPKQWKRIHNVFHVSLLKPYKAADHEQHKVVWGPQPIQWLDGEPIWRVEKLLDHRFVPRHPKSKQLVLQYLVRWKGYGEADDTWEPRSNLLTCSELIKAYKRSKGLANTESDGDDGDSNTEN